MANKEVEILQFNNEVFDIVDKQARQQLDNIANELGRDKQGNLIPLNTTAQEIRSAINELLSKIPSSGSGSGTNGREVELQSNGTHIQWRYVGDTDWNNLVALADLKGANGRGISNIEKTSGIDLDDEYTITYTDGTKSTFYVTNGAKGDTGEGVVAGGTTGQVLAKKSNTDYDTEWVDVSDTLVTTDIVDSVLALTTDKYQTTTIADGVEITLPTVTDFTEIHLFFSTDADLTLVLPSCKWQNGTVPTISANKVYEFIFTFTDEWLGGVIEYVA